MSPKPLSVSLLTFFSLWEQSVLVKDCLVIIVEALSITSRNETVIELISVDGLSSFSSREEIAVIETFPYRRWSAFNNILQSIKIQICGKFIIFFIMRTNSGRWSGFQLFLAKHQDQKFFQYEKKTVVDGAVSIISGKAPRSKSELSLSFFSFWEQTVDDGMLSIIFCNSPIWKSMEGTSFLSSTRTKTGC